MQTNHKHKACKKAIEQHGYVLTACCVCTAHRCRARDRKDLMRAIAGHLGGKLSPTSFNKRKDLAAKAGSISAWEKQSGKLQDFPIFFEEMATANPLGRRKLRRQKNVVR